MNFNLKFILPLLLVSITVIYFVSLSSCEYYINNKKVNKQVYFKMKGSANSSRCNAKYVNVCECWNLLEIWVIEGLQMLFKIKHQIKKISMKEIY